MESTKLTINEGMKMKRRSLPKRGKSRGTYSRKVREGNMMYGPVSHAERDYIIAAADRRASK